MEKLTGKAMRISDYLKTKNGKAFRRLLKAQIKRVGEKKCKYTKKGCPAWDYVLLNEADVILDQATEPGAWVDIDVDSSIKDATPVEVYASVISWKMSDYSNNILGSREEDRRDEFSAMFSPWTQDENGDLLELED
jgi:hypothetical protein